MYKNEDRALNPVELTHEELSLASGGFGPYFYPYGGFDVVDQAQLSVQKQKAFADHAKVAVIGQTQASVQNQEAVTH